MTSPTWGPCNAAGDSVLERRITRPEYLNLQDRSHTFWGYAARTLAACYYGYVLLSSIFYTQGANMPHSDSGPVCCKRILHGLPPVSGSVFLYPFNSKIGIDCALAATTAGS
ncbi:hypothetical protein BJV74DRAFT_795417 [Russula compacta]|nr:hypothetical protein BJV74DRAFT_795417 [Russula compacta]